MGGEQGAGLFISLFVGLFGMALFGYGRKQGRAPHLAGGLALLVFPWFVSEAWLIGVIGLGLIGLVAVASWLGL